MGRLNSIDLHSRRVLFTRVTSSISQGGSADFGAYNVDGYSRLTGIVLVHSHPGGTNTFQWRLAVNSGTPLVTSTTAILSGGVAFDVVNVGRVADFAVTAVASTTTYTTVIFGEPLR